MLMYAPNTGHHLEDSYTKGKRDTCIIPHMYCTRFRLLLTDKLMQRVEASGGLERPTNRSTEQHGGRTKYCSKTPCMPGSVPYSYVDWAHFEGWLYCTICGQLMRYQKGRRWSYYWAQGYKPIVQSRTRFWPNPCQYSHISVDAVRTLTVFALVPSPEFV